MRTIMAVVAAVGLLGMVAASAPARAQDYDDEDGWRRQEWREHQWRRQEWREHEWHERALQAYAPPPVVYAPAPTYYAPPPVYYAPPPVYRAPGFSIGFGFR